MYQTYIQGYDHAMALLTEAMKKYPQFAVAVRDFQVFKLIPKFYLRQPLRRKEFI